MADEDSLKNADVIILEADGLIDAEHGYGYPVKERLSEQGFNSVIYPIEHQTANLQHLPKKPLIISGGMTEVTADIKWIRELKNFIRNVIRENESKPSQPVLGICFGAQVIAECLNPGSVLYLEDPEIGVSQIELDIPDHPLFKGFKPSFPAYSFHYNQVKADDFIVISDHVHMGHHFIQAFEVPDGLAFGVQFHPEFKQEQMLKLFTTYKDLIADLGFDLSPVISSLPNLVGNERMLHNFLNIL